MKHHGRQALICEIISCHDEQAVWKDHERTAATREDRSVATSQTDTKCNAHHQHDIDECRINRVFVFALAFTISKHIET